MMKHRSVLSRQVVPRENKTARFSFMLEPSLRKQWDAFAISVDEDASELAREAIRSFMTESEEVIAAKGNFHASVLASVPCGPLAEAMEKSDVFVVNNDTADFLEARDGDFWITAQGDSMEGVGIFKGDLCLMRFLKFGTPLEGDIVLAQIVDEEGGIYEGTLKQWTEDGTLVNGDDEPYEIPEGREIRPLAVMKGVMGRRGRR